WHKQDHRRNQSQEEIHRPFQIHIPKFFRPSIDDPAFAAVVCRIVKKRFASTVGHGVLSCAGFVHYRPVHWEGTAQACFLGKLSRGIKAQQVISRWPALGVGD
ncbi:hypothetical protein ACCT30_49915, partial [Rhizobium ruizarguesonis]